MGEQQVWQCADCGVGITMPALPDVAFLYEDRESQDFQQKSNRLTHWIKRLAFGRQALGLLRDADCQPSNVLDYGCGSGLFTRRLDDLLPEGQVMGADFHESPPQDLIDRAYTPMRGLGALAGTFDLVIAMHVLEHDDDALGLLRRIADMARPGGTLVIEVPNIDCVWTRVFGRAWDAWYLPYHRSHFSRASLRGLAEAAGLEVVKDVPVCVPTMGRSLANLFGAEKGLAFLLVGIALHPLQWLGEKLSGRSSALRMVLRKP
jgi:SAM-dependent methyltransferase